MGLSWGLGTVLVILSILDHKRLFPSLTATSPDLGPFSAVYSLSHTVVGAGAFISISSAARLRSPFIYCYSRPTFRIQQQQTGGPKYGESTFSATSFGSED